MILAHPEGLNFRQETGGKIHAGAAWRSRRDLCFPFAAMSGIKELPPAKEGRTMRRFLLTLLICLLAAPAARAQWQNPISGRFLLSDMDGRTVTDEAYRGKIRLVTFGYTFCPDICPTTLNTLSVALDRLGADRAKVATLFVSVDPERDSPAHLKDYLNAFPEITGLTGTPEQVAAAARNFHVRYERQKAEGSDPMAYTVDHSSSIYIMDREGNYITRWPHGADPNRLAERVEAVLHPDRPIPEPKEE
jgi:protein SCO1